MQKDEDILHLFLKCPRAQSIWQAVGWSPPASIDRIEQLCLLFPQFRNVIAELKVQSSLLSYGIYQNVETQKSSGTWTNKTPPFFSDVRMISPFGVIDATNVRINGGASGGAGGARAPPTGAAPLEPLLQPHHEISSMEEEKEMLEVEDKDILRFQPPISNFSGSAPVYMQ
ncbi:hypothetical protein ACP70R_004410 [Stipagrostis hirtigluma subsp. patula]